MHAEESTHHSVNPEDADVRERSMRFSGEPGQWGEIKLAEIQVGGEILETCGGNHIKFVETQVGHQFLGADGTQATSLVPRY